MHSLAFLVYDGKGERAVHLQRSGADVGFSPDRSAVEIQYAAAYTEGILPSIQYILQLCFPILYLQRSGAHVGFSPDRSAVEIQYATVYTEGILPSIQYILQRCFPILYLYCTSVRARVLHCSFQHADLDN